MPKNKLLNKYLNFILAAIGIAAAIFLLPLIFKLFMPFILGFLIAAMCQKIIHFLEHRFKINRGISSAFLIIFIVGIITLILSFLIYQLYIQLSEIFLSFPEFIDEIRFKGNELYLKFSAIYDNLPNDLQNYVKNFLENMQDSLRNASAPIIKNIITFAKNFAFSLPEAIMFLIMFILSTFFFTKDYHQVVNFAKEILSKPFLSKVVFLKDTIFGAFLKYLKAQLIMMSIICSEVTLALWILGVSYPLVWGLIIGFTDALPFLGTAIILVPWSIANLLYGDYLLALALIILQCTTFITRQMLEPRIVSSQIGLHPILTLISIYVGLRLFGVVGMIITPIFMLLAVNFYVSYKEGKNEFLKDSNSNAGKETEKEEGTDK